MSTFQSATATAQARIPTQRAARYLSQLCKHFDHKLPVTLGEAEGRIAFPFGTCALRAEDGVLVMTAEAADAATLAQVEDVIDRHLLRFAFRDVETIAWNAAVQEPTGHVPAA
jgi:uncharacterized protein